MGAGGRHAGRAGRHPVGAARQRLRRGAPGIAAGGVMGQIATLLGDTRPALSDGAIGTVLQAAGLMPGASPEIWNVERGDAMRVIHTAYADAGARLLTTNTFGGTRPRLALHGHEDRVHELNEAGARLAAESAAPAGALVLGRIGPTRALMEPLGTLAHHHALELFAEQA